MQSISRSKPTPSRATNVEKILFGFQKKTEMTSTAEEGIEEDQPGDLFSRSLVAGFSGTGGQGHISDSPKMAGRRELVWEGGNWYSAALASHHAPGPGEVVEVVFDIFSVEGSPSSNTNIGVVLSDSRDHAMNG
jgi:hypothetical protein